MPQRVNTQIGMLSALELEAHFFEIYSVMLPVEFEPTTAPYAFAGKTARCPVLCTFSKGLSSDGISEKSADPKKLHRLVRLRFLPSSCHVSSGRFSDDERQPTRAPALKLVGSATGLRSFWGGASHRISNIRYRN